MNKKIKKNITNKKEETPTKGDLAQDTKIQDSHSEKQDLSLGLFLKNRRQLLKIDIENIAKSLNVKKQYIELLEDDKLDQLHEKMVYIEGLIKSYTKLLHLDQEMENELGSLLKKKEFNGLSILNAKPYIKPTRKILKYSIVALLIIYLALIIVSKVERKAFSYDIQQNGLKYGL